MEKKLHPLFYAKESENIQRQFDPTPQNLVRNFIEDKQETKPLNTSSQEVQFRTNRLTQKVGNLEDRIENIATEVRSAYSQLAGRVKECLHRDHKVEALIERHNQIVNAFEKRMGQMTKLLEESQAQLISSQGSLDEARREIARLKTFNRS